MCGSEGDGAKARCKLKPALCCAGSIESGRTEIEELAVGAFAASDARYVRGDLLL